MYTDALFGEHAGDGQAVAFCDARADNIDQANRRLADKFGAAPLPGYAPEDFERMLRQERVDSAIVCSVDRTHHDYICRALRAGCDAVAEKPMTIDAPKCQQVVDAVKETGRNLTVAFNYRYAPAHSKVKEVLQSGVVGEVLSVNFEWRLPITHGSAYFRRWHRDKRNSGGLVVHKSTHHFDLAHWWVGSRPRTVFGMGGLSFYGPANADERRLSERERMAFDYAAFAWPRHDRTPEEVDEVVAQVKSGGGNYYRQYSVFETGVSSEDTMGVLVRYASGAIMSYHVHFYSPIGGLAIAFNGTKGRLEYHSGGGAVAGNPYLEKEGGLPKADLPGGSLVDGSPVHAKRLVALPFWSKPIEIELPQGKGGHGGGDALLLRDVFGGGEGGPDPLGRAAGYLDGAYSILTGAAANRSFASDQAVDIEDLVAL